ncbi:MULTISPECIES: hypothetical protein [Aequorivita]|uniref:Lipoprotein n=1 Tax=Aequorivita iocasae TaxID=2803865 RepID=A0ABX7DPV1_9FLAO|nr:MULTISPECIES: hypothetical protein [Aequorivita]QQX76176.1 hypothetical protein JK629_12670 [Aequorivita iocasae]UCA55636.1 hypothetical protein LDL78_12725 [Aequorivita sp. F7]
MLLLACSNNEAMLLYEIQMNYNKEIWEEKMHRDVFKVKSTLLYINEDIPLVMNLVTYSQYNRIIPNLFERLLGYKNELLSIAGEVKTFAEEIDLFENRINLFAIHEAPNTLKVLEEAYNILLTQIEKLKTDYDKIKDEILTFTDSLKNEKFK